MKRCDNCVHWQRATREGLQDYGLCQARPERIERVAHYTADSNECRVGKFVPIVPAKVAATHR